MCTVVLVHVFLSLSLSYIVFSESQALSTHSTCGAFILYRATPSLLIHGSAAAIHHHTLPLVMLPMTLPNKIELCPRVFVETLAHAVCRR